MRGNWGDGTFLALLDDRHRKLVFDAGRVAEYGTGQAIVREQDRTDFVAVLESGRACISRYVDTGREATLAIRGPGELIGELAAVLDDADGRSASAVALEPVRARILTQVAFVDLLHAESAVMFGALQHLAHRLRSESARAEVSTGSANRRVARLLAQRAVEVAAGSGASSVEVGAGLSQATIADLTGVSRESVVRALRRLRDDGCIRTARQSIEVLDLGSLAAHAVG